jgi:D-arabinose 5-phosphate isomerase GutQ
MQLSILMRPAPGAAPSLHQPMICATISRISSGVSEVCSGMRGVRVVVSGIGRSALIGAGFIVLFMNPF